MSYTKLVVLVLLSPFGNAITACSDDSSSDSGEAPSDSGEVLVWDAGGGDTGQDGPTDVTQDTRQDDTGSNDTNLPDLPELPDLGDLADDSASSDAESDLSEDVSDVSDDAGDTRQTDSEVDDVADADAADGGGADTADGLDTADIGPDLTGVPVDPPEPVCLPNVPCCVDDAGCVGAMDEDVCVAALPCLVPAVIALVDEQVNGAIHTDLIVIINAVTGEEIDRINGLGIQSAVGFNNLIASSPDLLSWAFAENGADRVHMFDHTGASLIDEDSATNADSGVAFSRDRLFATNGSIIYEQTLRSFDRAGRPLDESPSANNGIIVSYDPQFDTLWTAAADMQSTDPETLVISNDYEALFVWSAVSMDVDPDGSMWVYEASHPSVDGSSDQLHHISSAGLILASWETGRAGPVLVDPRSGTVLFSDDTNIYTIDDDGDRDTVVLNWRASALAFDPILTDVFWAFGLLGELRRYDLAGTHLEPKLEYDFETRFHHLTTALVPAPSE